MTEPEKGNSMDSGGQPLNNITPLVVLTIKRTHHIESGTFGVIDADMNGVNTPFALTLEKPWRDNKPDVSCIPSGEYTCKKTISSKFGSTYEVLNVPNRTNILFHRGNTEEDTHGCILLGEQFEKMGEKPAILQSGKAFSEFIQITNGADSFKLVIMNV